MIEPELAAGAADSTMRAPLDAGAFLSRALFDQSPFSTVIYDAGGRLVAVNDAFRRFWGVGAETAPPNYCVLEDRQLEEQGALAYIRRAFQGEAVVTPPVRYDISKVSTNGQGRDIWTEAYLYPVLDESGVLANVVLVHVDITERMRAQEALSASDVRSRSLLSLATALSQAATFDEVANVVYAEGLKAIGADAGGLTLASEVDGVTRMQLIRATGYSPDSQLKFQDVTARAGRPLSDAVLRHEPVVLESAEEFRARYPEAFEADIAPLGLEAHVALPIIVGGRVVAGLSFSFRGPRRFDDDARTLLATIGQLCAQALERARAFDAERLARDAAEHAVERTRRLQSLTAALSRALTRDEVARVIVQQGILATNAQAALVLLLSEDGRRLRAHASTGYPDETLVVLRDVPVAANYPMRDAAAGRAVFLSSLDEWTKKYDPPVWTTPAAQAAAILPLAGGTLRMGVLSIRYTDVHRFDGGECEFLLTLARQCGQALERAHFFSAERAARAEAEWANQAKMEFLATMSHELRTPLNAIGGYVELLEMGVRGPVTPEQQTDLQRIQRSQRHLLSLINDVLNFAKLEAGKVEVRLAPVAVAETLETLEPLLAPQLAAKQLAFEHRPVDPSLTVIADADKLRQVLLNILSNAMKFTPDGGRIDVFCEHDDREVRIVVRDTGIGIHSQYLERIFDPFVQLERRLTNVVGGTGLGLAISRDLARAMNGDVSVESRPNDGSTFRVHVPRGTFPSAE